MLKRRIQWLNQVSQQLAAPSRHKEAKEANPAPPVESVLTMYCGAGYLLGFNIEEISIADSVSPDVATRTVERWRGGGIPSRFAYHALENYMSIFACVRDLGMMPIELAASLENSPVHGRLREYYGESRMLLAERNPDWTIAVDRFKNSESKSNPIEPYSQLINAIAQADLELASSIFTPLELRELPEFVDLEAKDYSTLNRWFMIKESYKLIDGWPAHANVPPWIIQMVTEYNGRFFPASAGATPTLAFTAETDEQARAFLAWTYNPCIGLRVAGDVIKIIVRFPTDTGPVEIFYNFSLQNWMSQAELRALISVGAVRFDCYKLDKEGTVGYVMSYGIPLPEEFSEEVVRLLPNELEGDAFTSASKAASESDDSELIIRIMEFSDSSSSDPAALQFVADSLEISEQVELSKKNYLEAVHIAAVSGNSYAEESVGQARDQLLLALSRTNRNPTRFIPGILASSEAYLQLSLSQTTFSVVAFVCIDTGESYRGERIELPLDLQRGIGDLSLIGQLVPELDRLLADDVTTVYIGAKGMLSKVPWHHIFLEYGFQHVSYVPSLKSIATRTRTRFDNTGLRDRRTAIVRGHPGPEDDELLAVKSEVAITSSFYSPYGILGPEQQPPDVIHLSGHGRTGATLENVILADSEASPITAAEVLNSGSSFAAEVVVLSGCNTGSVSTSFDQVLSTMSLEESFLRAGARSAISTALPINDYVAFVFSVAFHYKYSSGSTAWSAFMYARQCASGDVDDNLRRIIEKDSPDSLARFGRALESASEHWKLFRFSGSLN